jgi:hypothetical protein
MFGLQSAYFPELFGTRVRYSGASFRVVMDDLPRTGFAAIDICNSIRNRDLLPSKLELPSLNTQFLGHVPSDMNDLIS